MNTEFILKNGGRGLYDWLQFYHFKGKLPTTDMINDIKNKDEVLKAYYGTNFTKSINRIKLETDKRKSEILVKYPKADLSKFVFAPNIDSEGNVIGKTSVYFNDGGRFVNIGSYEFIHSKPMWIFLHNRVDRFPKIWSSNGSVPELPKGNYDKQWKLWDGYPLHPVLDYPIHNFRVYVNNKDYFMSKLPILSITTSWDDRESYYRALFAVYCSSFCCGVCIKHLTPSDDVYPIITSIMRFHLFFTVRRILKRMDAGERMSDISREFGAVYLYGHSDKVPWDNHYQSYRDSEGRRATRSLRYLKSDYKNDYKRYIPKVSDGFTKIGIKYIQESVESYVYAVLGSQAKTRWSIVGLGAKSSQTQDVFRQIVDDTIIQTDTTVTISNMRRAISDTNVILDLAISPDIIPIPSKMIILAEPIPGYNNILTNANSKMRFGLNPKVNYVGVKKKPLKKEHQEEQSANHLDNLVDKDKLDKVIDKKPTVKKTADHNSELMALFFVTGIAGYVVLKYVL